MSADIDSAAQIRMDVLVQQLNAQENWNWLQSATRVSQHLDPNTGQMTQLRLPQYGVALEAGLLTKFPLNFRAIIERVLRDAAIQRSRLAYEREQQRRVKPVSKDFGEQFRFKKSMKGFPMCTICQEEFKSNEKVWKLHGDQCCFHKRCLTKWFKRSSKCPNCNGDCASVACANV